MIDPLRHPYRFNWGKDEDECRRNYGEQIGSCQDDDERNIFTEGGSWLGDEQFKAGLQSVSGRLTARKRGRRKVQ